jgi:anti-anti-sigma regulatory factor
MMTCYKIVSQPHPADHAITLLLNGKFDEDSLGELERSISEAESDHLRVCIDLSEVTLLDRATARYFSGLAANGIRFVNCPIYLRQWIPQVSDDNE